MSLSLGHLTGRMELSALRITLLVLLAVIMVSMVMFVCLCCLRTRRNLRLRDTRTPSQLTPLLADTRVSGVRESLPSLNYNDTLSRSARYQATPFTQASRLRGDTQSDLPRYDDLYGTSAQPYSSPTLLLDDG